MNSSQKELSSSSCAITKHALKNKIKNLVIFVHSVVWCQTSIAFSTSLYHMMSVTVSKGFTSLFTNLVLISASKRTAAITGLEPSPVAGRDV